MPCAAAECYALLGICNLWKMTMRLFGPGCMNRVLALGLVLVAASAGEGTALPASGPQPAASASGDTASANAALLSRARKLVQDGDPQGAISLLETADLQTSNTASASDIHALKGICLALLARPVDSAAEFDAAIALRPSYAPTYLSAGLAFASFNNLDRALDRLAGALKLDPKLPGVRYNYALVLARAGRFAESEQQVQIELDRLDNPHGKAASATDSVLDLWRLKARDAYYQKQWAETLEAYRKTLKLDPGWPEAYGAIGEALFSLNRSEESLPMLEKSEALDPENATTHALLGKVYQDAAKVPMAIHEFEQAQRLRPNDQDVTYHLLRLYRQSGDTGNANLTVQRLKELTANRYNESLSETRASALNNAGLELEKQGDLTGALKDFDEAAGEDATNLIFKRNAALILCRLGKTEEAIRRLRDILDLDPDDAQTLQILSVAKEFELKRPGNVPNLPSLEPVR
jgi:tetratricopeptide (TPR) repeat protein